MKKSISLLSFALIYCMSAYTQPGSLDLYFANGGKLFFNFSNTNSNNEAIKKVFPLPDGKTIVAFSERHALITTRLLADGRMDTTYGNNGYSEILPIDAFDAGIQPDDKIVLVGSKFVMREDGGGSSFIALGRLTADGKTDTTFNKTGFLVLNDYGNLGTPNPIVIQNDGKIIIATQVGNNAIVIRFTTEGSFDTSFGNNGVVKSTFPDNYPNFTSILITAENKIIAAGYLFNYLQNKVFLLKYNSNGSMDTAFSVENKQIIDLKLDPNLNLRLNAVALQTDDKILLAGSTVDNSTWPYTNNAFAARLLSDGSLDSSFNSTGLISLPGYSNSIAVQQNGKILLTGGDQNGVQIVSRINTEGSIDTIFGNKGKIGVVVDGKNVYGGYTVTTNWSFFVTGSAYLSNGNSDGIVLKYNTDGQPDNSFSNDGIATIYLEGGLSEATGLLKLPDGKLFSVGSESNGYDLPKIAFAKFLPDGEKDTAFGSNGKIMTSFHLPGPSKMQQDGKILVASLESYIPKLLRFDNNGILDISFADSGMVSLSPIPDYNFFNNILSIEIQNDKKILALALVLSTLNFNEYSLALYRFNQDGTPDTEFANNGIQLFPAGTFILGCSSSGCIYGNRAFTDAKILVRNDQKINIVGALAKDISSSLYGKNLYLARLNSDGSFDPDFGIEGKLISTFEIYIEKISALIQSDNKIIVNSWLYLMRFNEDGILDNTFGNNGNATYVTDFAGSNLALQDDGKILKIGYLNNVGNLLYRFNTNGSIDSTFGHTGYVKFLDDINNDGYLTNLLVNDNKVYTYGYANYPIQKAAIELVDLGEMQFSNLPGATEIKQMVWPNPSQQQFTLQVVSNSNVPVELKVFDMVGRQVYLIKGSANLQYQFGSEFKSGIYIAEVRQGNVRSTVKLIKQ